MTIEVKSIHEPRRRLPRFASARKQVRTAAREGRRSYRLRRAFAAATLVALSAFAGFLCYSYHAAARVVDERLAAGYLTSRAGLYAAPRVLRPGQAYSRERLVEALGRAGYVERAASNVWSGGFTQGTNFVEIRPRRGAVEGDQSEDAANAPEVVRVSFDRKGRIEHIVAEAGAALDSFTLEPEALTHHAAVKNGERRALSYTDLPPHLVKAILAIEDRRFFEHDGVDPTGMLRALLSWVGVGTSVEMRRQGGSTVTQQLVKNTYLTHEKTLRRKYNEAMLAAALERRLSKEDIFALYCNEIYLGQRGTFAVRGVGQAAHVFFGKELKDLSLAEAATLAGMIRSPNRYAPDRYPEEARARRDTVIDAMLRDGSISSEQADAARREAFALAPFTGADEATAPYFVDHVNRLVEAKLASHGGGGLDERNLRVQTTIDLDLQRLAEAAIGRQLAKLEKVYAKKGTKPQAAFVALDAANGHVLAMVGGRHYGESQLNRASDARRQPGSVYKPFVYAAALEGGLSPVATFADAPREFTYDSRAKYRPANYGGGYSMRDVTLREGLVRSLNVVTVDVALRAGLNRVAALAGAFGLKRPEPYPALALGTTEATPLEIASAYTAFANGGVRAPALAVTRAFDGDGSELIGDLVARPQEQSIRPSTAYIITDMLGDVIREGTARTARDLAKQTEIAGKTGTSRDGWFAGYTPRLVCVVWVGFDDNQQLGLTGAESALPVWQEFMREALELRPELAGGGAFVRPDSVRFVEIDPETGLRASPSCPRRQRIAVTDALAPGFECYTHKDALALFAYEQTPAGEQVATPVEITAYDASLTGAPPPAVRVPQLPAGRPPRAATTTRVETDAGGRKRLTNELRLVESPEQ
ncbi:MAG: transglycosylase domain-containing protein [Pyrinomonadaceae bacterium]